ncbi:MAG: ABC transporter substrate-binding protein [Anaerolineaceae bacterium]
MRRRWFFLLSVELIISLVFGACSPEKETVQEQIEPAVTSWLSPNSLYNQAPQLAELVAAGKLPSVEQRLPINPMLIQPEDRIGVYGGVWHLAMVKTDPLFMLRVVGYESLVRWDKGWTRIIPNVTQSYEVSPDSRTFTFKLREGMKWSDGQPFSADDILFWYEAIYLNDDLHFLVDTWIDVGKDKLIVEKLNDYTVVFRFTEPRGLFLQHLATMWGSFPTSFPRHYLMKFHKDYNPDIDKLVTQEGVKDWVELFMKKTRQNLNGNLFSTVPELPTLFAWVLEPGSFNADGVPASVVRAVRNPYYWKIDTEYNQLPYIDSIEFKVVENSKDILPLVQAGKVDMQDRNIPSSAALSENQAKGDYVLYELVSCFSNYMAISFNLTHDDPIKRQIFQNKDFRIGLSYAINRPAIIDASKFDVKPYQVAPTEGTPFYNDEMATQYLEYNVDLANEYLDRSGYDQRDTAGFRLGPDGKRISFTMLIPTPIPIGNFDVDLPMIQADWKAVGIEMAIETVTRAEAEKRWTNNEYDVTAFTGAGGYDVILAPRHYVPAEGIWSQQGIRWANWYKNPNDPQAEEPPAPVKETIMLYQQLLQTADSEQQQKLMINIIDIASDQFQVIGIHQVPVSYGVIKPNFRNVPPLMFSSANYPQPAPTNPCQYFIEQP